MNDLISRQAAIEETWKEPSYTDPLNVLTELRDRIKDLPSAQPEIIRCKDCKWHWRVTESRTSGYCENDKCFDGVHFETDNDFYCGYAERKEE